MKRMWMAACVAAAVFVLPAVAAAQASDNASMTVSVNVIQALSLTKTGGDLNFGTMAAGTTASEAMETGIEFEAAGQVGAAISVTFSNALLGLTDQLTFVPQVGASATSTGTFTAVASGDGVTLSASTGHHFFRVGGSVVIPAGHPAGAYSGQFTLTVAYTGL
jgi:hypothetical protein